MHIVQICAFGEDNHTLELQLLYPDQHKTDHLKDNQPNSFELKNVQFCTQIKKLLAVLQKLIHGQTR